MFRRLFAPKPPAPLNTELVRVLLGITEVLRDHNRLLRRVMATLEELQSDVTALKAQVAATGLAVSDVATAVQSEIDRVNTVIQTLKDRLEGGAISSSDLDAAVNEIVAATTSLQTSQQALAAATGALNSEQPTTDTAPVPPADSATA